MSKSILEQEFDWLIATHKMPKPEKEYKFHPKRRWRFDFAWPEKKVAVEIEGGVWVGGGHNRPVHFLKDIEKYNQAVAMDWKIFRIGSQRNHLILNDLELIKKMIA